MKYILKRQRPISILLILIIILNCIPIHLFALTGGPSQPEVESFKPIEVTDMVDPATGDFSYNIPLLEVGGYPINLIYNAGVTMDQEASMVGLGWNINPGVITRSVRGIPDDFNGDLIEKKIDMKDNITRGFNYGPKFELFGIDQKAYKGKQVNLHASLGMNYNNYTGFGLEFGFTPTLSGGEKCMPGLSLSLGLTASSKEGIGFSPNISYTKAISNSKYGALSLSGGLGTNINSRLGLKALTYSVGANLTNDGHVNGKDAQGQSVSSYIQSNHSLVSGSSSLVNFSSESYVPNIEYPLVNNSYTFQGSLALEGMGAFTGGFLSGYYTKQQLEKKFFKTPSYGVAYLSDGKNHDGLLDFNREKDGSFSREKPNLPMPFQTQDVFSVSGQGIGGSYQIYRGDVGVIFDKKAKNRSNGYSLGVEAGLGQAFRLGGDIHINFSNTYTGRWQEDDEILKDDLNFWDDYNKLNEPHYFKAAGEASPFMMGEENVFTSTGRESAVKIGLDKSSSEVKLKSNFESNNGSSFPINGNIHRLNRAKRNQSITYLTATEASKFGLDKKIISYNLGLDSKIEITRNDVNKKVHHISEITVLRPDGLKYIYGIPAYNNVQYEIAFNRDPSQFSDCNIGLVGYQPENGNVTPKHEFGIDNFLDQEKTPAFAHSYLLSAIVSDDYIDKTGDGLSHDDLGTYTKFNYTRLHSAYKWRVPYQDANFNPGFNSKSDDDKANFTYGEKEIWILHSIESKTHIAVLAYGHRHDGHGVSGYTGGRDNLMSLKKLENISLYSLPDYNLNTASNRTLIKSVHFEYDYSLCSNVPTNDEINENVVDFDINGNQITKNINIARGKLTLKKIYFKYGKSNKGRFSPYMFKYSGDPSLESSQKGINPSYNIKGYNRWGTFMHVNTKFFNNNTISCNQNDKLTTSEYMYIPQIDDYDTFDEQGYADNISGAWNLREINLPSSGKIQVDYEADDYAYVQDKSAMQLIQIEGFGRNLTDPYSNNLYENSGPNNYVFFKLSSPIPVGMDSRNYLFNHYLKDAYFTGNLFFKIFTDIDNTGNFEYVQGYTEIEDWGVKGNNLGYIKIKSACTKDKEIIDSNNNCSGMNNISCNPISKTIWQFARLHLPRLVYGSPSSSVSDNANDFISVGNAFKSWFHDFKPIFQGGINNYLLDKSYGKTTINEKSWIRLNNPRWDKLAGTHRIKKITISDDWSNMTDGNQSTSIYGQEYEYTTHHILNKETIIISSGVASYEPLIGSEENPFKQPLTYKQVNKFAPDDSYYIDGPIGESFYPGPQIVYSKVKIKNITYSNVNKKATGWIIHEFYTAKDFPTKVSQTKLDAAPKKTLKLLKLIKIKNNDQMTTSQGYSIELNDMHGKEKTKKVFNQTGTLISSISTFYKTNNNQLINEVPLLMNNGIVVQGIIGLDYNLTVDQREAKSSTLGVGVNMNNDNFFVGPILIPSFVPFPFFNSEKTKYRSVVMNKIIHRAGILSHTIAYDLGSTVETRNLAWDGITGEVICTQTFNEFEDPIYNFNYPAHWAYKGMQNAYKNINAFYNNVSIGSNGIANVGPGHPFCEGDEVSINSLDKAWVKSITSTSIELIDYAGSHIANGNKSIKIIRSGHRNKASTSIGSVVSLQNPLSSGSLVLNGSKKVINTTAIEFDDKRNVPCCETNIKTCPCSDIKLNGVPVRQIYGSAINQIDFSNVNNSFQPMPSQVANLLSPIFSPLYNNQCLINQTNFLYKIEEEITYPPGTPFYGHMKIYKIKSTVDNCECNLNVQAKENFKQIEILRYGYDYKCYNFTMRPYAKITRLDGTQFMDFIHVYTTCFSFFENCNKVYPPFNKWFTDPFSFYPINQGNTTPIVQNTNPYTTNQKGTYTPKKSYTFLADRKSSASSITEPDLKSDGYFTNFAGNPFFDPFWKKTGNGWVKDPTDWTWTAEVTKIHPNGNELESRDPLDRYSSELLGYKDHMVTAVAGNARYGDCMFDGFEDYRYSIGISPNNNSCPYKYFKFPEAEPVLDFSQCHSGKYYQPIQAGMATYADYKLYDCKPSEGLLEGRITSVDSTDHSIPCDCLNEFNPKPGKYVFSAWIKEGNDPLQHDFQDSKCIVKIDNTINTFKASGPIIEGWQRVYGEFTIPNGAAKIQIGLIASPTELTGFDDIRIHPFDASFKSFVYDDITLRFTYELDENNYFTKYEYDDSGKLERVKKETERGVMTVQETRFSNKKVK